MGAGTAEHAGGIWFIYHYWIGIGDKLANEGYDYVFGFDGGSSSTLIKGGTNKYVEPKWYKDNTIPTGVTITGDK